MILREGKKGKVAKGERLTAKWLKGNSLLRFLQLTSVA